MTAATLHLSVQYATTRPAPRRDQVRRWVRGALHAIDRPEASLTIRFVDVDEGRTLNKQFRGKDYATNVLTFPYELDERGSTRVEADIVICMPVVDREARAQLKDVMIHCAHLVIHGVLHASGRDHEDPDEAEAMEAEERRVLARFGIADPYAS